MSISESLSKFLNDVGNIAARETADVLSTVINSEISITLEKISDTDSNILAEAFPEPVLSIRFNLSPQEEDVAFLAINQSLAAQLALLMTAETGEKGELTDSHIEAIRDMAEQVLSTLGIPIGEKLNREVKFGSVRAEVMDMKIDFPPLLDPVSVSYAVKTGEEESHTVLLVAALETLEKFEHGESAAPEQAEDERGGSKELLFDEKGEAGGAGEESMKDIASEESAPTPGMEDMFGGGSRTAVDTQMGADDLTMAAFPRPPGAAPEKVELLLDLSLPVSIELGRTKMLIKDILELGHGSVIEFDKLAGEPVDLLIYDKKIAEGEVVVIDEHFGIRLTNIIKPSDRIKNLGK